MHPTRYDSPRQLPDHATRREEDLFSALLSVWRAAALAGAEEAAGRASFASLRDALQKIGEASARALALHAAAVALPTGRAG